MPRSASKVFQLGDGTQVQLLCWTLSGTGITTSCVGDLYSVSQGQTAFGLTAPTGTCKLRYVGFSTNIRDYFNTVGVNAIVAENLSDPGSVYNLNGQRVADSYKGIVVVEGRKCMQ